MSPEDKDNFLLSKIIDKITDKEFWENTLSPLKITLNQFQIVITELSYNPYGKLAVLMFPEHFHQFDLLDSTLKKISFDDIYEFVTARKENTNHLEHFIKEKLSQLVEQKIHQNIYTSFEAILTKAKEIMT